MINDSFETANKICNRKSASRRRDLDRPAWIAIAILVFAGCLNFASTDRARAQEAQTISCERKCTNVKNKCHNDGGTDEMCDYDYKVCKKDCSEQK
jgi:hypothetical protein